MTWDRRRIVLLAAGLGLAVVVARSFVTTDYLIRRRVTMTGQAEDDLRLAERDMLVALRHGAVFVASDLYETGGWDEATDDGHGPLPVGGWYAGTEPDGQKAGWSVSGQYALLSFDEFAPDRRVAGFEWASGGDGGAGTMRYYSYLRVPMGAFVVPTALFAWLYWRRGRERRRPGFQVEMARDGAGT